MVGNQTMIALAELYDFSSGLSKPRSAFGSGYPFLTFKDVFYNIFVPQELGDLVNSTDRERDSCSIKRGDVFLTRTSETMDELGMSCVALRDVDSATFNGFTKRLRPKSTVKILPEYAGYFFRSKWFRDQVTAMSSMSTRASLNNEMLGRLQMILPDITTQHAIACILKSLDDKINLNRRMNRTLEAIARAIFKSWFVDFEPVRSKAANQHPPRLKSELAAIFPDSLEESKLGEIPRGWLTSSLGQHFHLTMGQSPPGSTYNVTGKGLPFYQGRTDFGFRFPSRRVFCTAPTRFAEPGDTLVSVRAPVGDINMANERCAVGRGVAAIRHHSGGPSFTYYSMHQLGCHFGKFEAEGTVFGCINKADFERLPFVVPSPEIHRTFDRIVLPLDKRIETNEKQILVLAGLRSALLPMLITGELSILNAERVAWGCF
ncbi:MAG: restriction endonuclease subunit S [Syntrophobacteraceae bacterium]